MTRVKDLSLTEYNHVMSEAVEAIKARYGAKWPRSEQLAILLLGFGATLERARDHAKAVEVYEGVVAVSWVFPRLVKAHMGLMRSYLALYRVDDATQHLNAASQVARIYAGFDWGNSHIRLAGRRKPFLGILE
jgi:hypothetical protein